MAISIASGQGHEMLEQEERSNDGLPADPFRRTQDGGWISGEVEAGMTLFIVVRLIIDPGMRLGWVDWRLSTVRLNHSPFQKRLEKKKKRLADEEYQRLVAEAKARGETDECPVCDSDYRKKEDVVKCTQGHAFCARCLKNVCWELVAGQVKVSDRLYVEGRNKDATVSVFSSP